MHCRRIENPEFLSLWNSPNHIKLLSFSSFFRKSKSMLSAFFKTIRFYKPGAFIHLCTTLEDHSSFIYPIAVDSLAIPFQGPDFLHSLKNETSITSFSCKLKAVLSS